MGRVMQASQDNPSAEALDAAAEILKNGGVIVSPTDSVYGLVCAATTGNPAHQRIFAIKNRPATQTLPLFVADPEDLLRFAATIRPCETRLCETLRKRQLLWLPERGI